MTKRISLESSGGGGVGGEKATGSRVSVLDRLKYFIRPRGFET